MFLSCNDQVGILSNVFKYDGAGTSRRRKKPNVYERDGASLSTDISILKVTTPFSM